MKNINTKFNFISYIKRRAYLFQKAYFLRGEVKKNYYSQFGEDIGISKLFPAGYKGTYVDVGCFHPLKYSNTYMLYVAGWRGVNIDVDSVKIDVFSLRRPYDHNVACAVSNAHGKVICYVDGEYSLTTTLDPEFASRNDNYREKAVDCKPLSMIIDESPFSDQQIDLLSVDAEGHDLEVLESLDWNRYLPKVVAVESHFRVLEQVLQTETYNYLKIRGYQLVGWYGLTLLMKHQTYDPY